MRFMIKLLLGGCLLCNSVFALSKNDRLEIEEVIRNYAIAWNAYSGKGFGKDFTEDADFVNIFGMYFSGKSEIEKRHVQILQGFLKDSKLEIISSEFREIQPGVVIALVRWKLDNPMKVPAEKKIPIEIREGIFTQIFVYTKNEWKIAASQNTLIL